MCVCHVVAENKQGSAQLYENNERGPGGWNKRKGAVLSKKIKL